MSAVLVIGVGNPLRMDDGVGWRAVDAIAADPGLAGVRTMSTHQLLPELALDLCDAALVVIVDARAGEPPGAISVEPVEAGDGEPGAWSHHLDPSALAAMARDLYGATPRVVAIGVGVASMGMGEGCTPLVAAAIPRVVAAVATLAEPFELAPPVAVAHA